MPRSLRVQTTQLNRVKLALQRNGFPSQRALAQGERILCEQNLKEIVLVPTSA